MYRYFFETLDKILTIILSFKDELFLASKMHPIQKDHLKLTTFFLEVTSDILIIPKGSRQDHY